MMNPDPERLLVPISDSDRVGPDLAYDPRRHEIEQAFAASVSIDTNGIGTIESDIDWRRIVTLIIEQSAQTKDVWLAVYLCRAGARWGRLDIVEAGLRYLAGLIEHYWEDCHPQLPDYGPEGRIGACDTLTSFSAFTGPLRTMILLDHPRHGAFSGQDLQRFQRGGETEVGYGSFRATLEEPASLGRLGETLSRIEAIDRLFHDVDLALGERAGGGLGASFGPIYEVLSEIAAAARAFLPVAAIDEPIIEEVGTEGVPSAAQGIPAAVRSREDVVRVIDLAVDYYRRTEPHSPVPLLLGRAREWVQRDFLEVLEDIAPNAVGDARQLLHFRGGG
ncbi:type VI secretion system ImpA family N-terminal domain-containing protein [Novosphingobium sp.]|uniref:type VI secretion system protein TssA n=1 Tax=Novosphingobium sp. TaxID=1874826 RepID=UPI0031E43E0F